MAEEMYTIKCTNCGREIQVPSELEEFSCVYCGNKMKKPKPAVEAHPLPDELPELDTAIAGLVKCVSLHLDIHKNFNKYTYADTIEQYKALHFPSFAAIDKLMHDDPGAAGEIAARAASGFVDGIDELKTTEKRYRGRLGRDIYVTDMKILMAIYMTPAAYDMGLEGNQPLMEAILAEWVKRYPKEPFSLGTREKIEGGFKKHFFCFITSAVCDWDGKPDDCEELATLRAFRDGYMCSTPEGRALVGEYYDIGPLITACIEFGDDPSRVLPQLRDEYILPCVQDIKDGKYEVCKARYVSMVRRLESKYLRRAQ